MSDLTGRLQRAAIEIQRLRAVVTANDEQVRSAVRAIVMAECGEWRYHGVAVESVANRIAGHVAKQLAGPRHQARALTADEVTQLRHHIRDHQVTCATSCNLIDRLLAESAP